MEKLTSKRLKGYGQKAMKGTCVHFPQAIEEVSEQLPLGIKDSQVIVVTETLQNIEANEEFQCRPKLIKEKLTWLLANNHLYSDVQMVDRPDSDYLLHHIFVQQQNSNEQLNSNDQPKKASKVLKNRTLRTSK